MKAFEHGGNLQNFARKAECNTSDILDFSVNVNPLGAPEWLGAEAAKALASTSHYPDPHNTKLIQAAAKASGAAPEQILAGNGASELLSCFIRVAKDSIQQVIIPVPAYVDYRRVCEQCDLPILTIPMQKNTATQQTTRLNGSPQVHNVHNFSYNIQDINDIMNIPSLVILCSPSNPSGAVISVEEACSLAEQNPHSLILVDESFGDFNWPLDDSQNRLCRHRPDNIITLYSLTKFYAIPSLRAGLIFASAPWIEKIRAVQPSWSVNGIVQHIGPRLLQDTDYGERSRKILPLLRQKLKTALLETKAIDVAESQANYLLCKLRENSPVQSGEELNSKLLHYKIALRPCSNYEGLEDPKKWFRVAVLNESANDKLVAALQTILSTDEPKTVTASPKKTPAIMVLGTSSNAGKSVIAAALCRIFTQEGYKVMPFKAQNMSLNSFVTPDGKEMGRAQVTQAMACRQTPDVRMNPVLLKPGSDVGSQVIVMGEPVGNMKVGEYIRFKPKAFQAAKDAYDDLAKDADIVILEGAGSPAEINLKQHDIVNMNMAAYAEAKVLLVGDIDRGGVFASIVGTMELLTPEERNRVSGHLLNRFRGDPTLLDPALEFTLERTGVPVVGVVPYLPNLGLPEEDSVSFKEGLRAIAGEKHEKTIDIAVIDLPRISNFNDVDPLMIEPDVTVRVIRTAAELGNPDVIILPGSKSTVHDLAALHKSGLSQAILSIAKKQSVRLIGICGGFQMLGQTITDPHGLESSDKTVHGLGLLPIKTELGSGKILHQGKGTYLPTNEELVGYEIHHGKTQAMDENEVIVPCTINEQDEITGYSTKDGLIWGSYLHGIFDADPFRRSFINEQRKAKGWENLPIQMEYSMEESLNRLADHVRKSIRWEELKLEGLSVTSYSP
ncbi:MAG: cobyric acid synthase [Desulfovibrio sp.]